MHFFYTKFYILAKFYAKFLVAMYILNSGHTIIISRVLLPIPRVARTGALPAQTFEIDIEVEGKEEVREPRNICNLFFIPNCLVTSR